MDSVQLTLVFRKDKYTRGVFQGVYPSDKLPTSVSSYPALFIANVDTSDKPGSHWVAFHFTKDQEGEFFDSYGLPPNKYSRRQVFFAGHIPQVTTTGHSIFAPKQHKKVLTVLVERGKP